MSKFIEHLVAPIEDLRTRAFVYCALNLIGFLTILSVVILWTFYSPKSFFIVFAIFVAIRIFFGFTREKYNYYVDKQKTEETIKKYHKQQS